MLIQMASLCALPFIPLGPLDNDLLVDDSLAQPLFGVEVVAKAFYKLSNVILEDKWLREELAEFFNFFESIDQSLNCFLPFLRFDNYKMI